MTHEAGSLDLLNHPVAQELLVSREPARLAYRWSDGSPRVVPIWFHWDGSALVFGSPARAPKLRVLTQNPDVAVTIDSTSWPYRVLSIRGRATVEMLDSVSPEYAAAAERYLGPEAGRGWVEQIRDMRMGRIRVEPSWVNVLDFETRFPSALSA
jgi:hypothetical protein